MGPGSAGGQAKGGREGSWDSTPHDAPVRPAPGHLPPALRSGVPRHTPVLPISNEAGAPRSPRAPLRQFTLFPLLCASDNTTGHAAVLYLSRPYLPGQLLNLLPLVRPKAFPSCLTCSVSFNSCGSHRGLRSQGRGSNLVESRWLGRTPPRRAPPPRSRCQPRSSLGP